MSVTQIARNFADYLNRVAYRRESFTLVRGNKALAELRPLPQGRLLAELPALLESLPHLSPTEADSFAKDLATARDELRQAEVHDAWQS